MYVPTMGVLNIDGVINIMVAFQIEVVKNMLKVYKEGTLLGQNGVEGGRVVQYVRGTERGIGSSKSFRARQLP